MTLERTITTITTIISIKRLINRARPLALNAGVALLGLLVLCAGTPATAQTPLGTAIAYSRSGMKISGQIISGDYDFTFRLFDAAIAGNLIGSAITLNNININNGVLPVQTLDFGTGAFDGDERWIDLRARTGSEPFKTVGPRTRMLAVPYALALPGLRTDPDHISPNIIGGFQGNNVQGAGTFGATIAGGGGNSGGDPNTVTAALGSIGGGSDNTVSSSWGTIAGGSSNVVSGPSAFVGGGFDNTASGGNSVIGGGYVNTTSGNATTVGGGSTNIASGTAATVPGGVQNSATGDYSLATGRRGKAVHNGSFVWADSTNADFTSFTNNSFNARAVGGFYFYTSSNGTTGAVMAPGSGAWSALSDRNAKERFASVEGREVLERLASIEVSTWNYKTQDASIRHIGPMAQDFQAAFGVGEDDRHITSTDADGVLFAAVQALHEMALRQDAEMREQGAAMREMRDALTEKDAQIAAQTRQISAMRERLEQVERLIEVMARK